MAPAVDSAAIACILEATARGDARIKRVTQTGYGLVIELDAVDQVVSELKAKEKS